MSAAVCENRPINDKNVENKEQGVYIPDVIEERRRDSDGNMVTVQRYACGKLLGKGGFARCHLGTPVGSNGKYALKIVPKCNIAKPRARAKLQSEIRIHRCLNHAHVVRFDRCFEDSNNAYILLELCGNNSMSELMKRRKRLLEPEARYYMAQLISSLQYLHQNLVIHRDLKLGNLFIDHNMRIKVGDFGLAAKLNAPEERRVTVCGTPNYIAPEILSGGKEGHSFEVDIWSSGVLLYTLLVGKPPFETKEVKTTYKKILECNYTFPENTPVSEFAKSLIRNMLQTRPEKRPSLDDILSHPFFSHSSSFTPSMLPESAMREQPVFSSHSEISSHQQQMPQYQQYQHQHQQQRGMAPQSKAGSVVSRYGDENDPNAINRQAHPISSDVSNKMHFDQVDTGVNKPALIQETRDAVNAIAKASDACNLSSNAAKKIVKKPLGDSRSQLTNDTTTASASTRSSVPSSKAPTRSQSTMSANSGRFDIYQEGKSNSSNATTTIATSSNSSTQSNSSRTKSVESMPTANNIKKSLSERPVSATRCQTAAVDKTRKPLTVANSNEGYLQRHMQNRQQLQQQVDDLQQDLENIVVDENKSSNTQASGSGKWNHGKKPVQAWADEEAESETYTTRTPTNGPKEIEEQQINTLEAMHKMLDQSFINNHSPSANHFACNGKFFTSNQDGVSVSASTAKCWVVRYVDYTSKYGLGFLLNNGNAGVYFNDSTKVILSSDGTVFQYIERRKKESTISGEHVVQTHRMNAYPPELQKKVLLLRHFRNYLIEQQQACANNPETDNYSDPIHSLPLLQDTGASGADPSIPFGINSAIVPAEFLDKDVNSNSSDDMVYVKKWVRTRHAILFRLSNRTVQVVFFDRSEIILSSEARIVTYVNKQGVRAEHTLDAVMQEGRADIAKRLRYTKDIMHRLINPQTR